MFIESSAGLRRARIVVAGSFAAIVVAIAEAQQPPTPAPAPPPAPSPAPPSPPRTTPPPPSHPRPCPPARTRHPALLSALDTGARAAPDGSRQAIPGQGSS